MGVPERGLHWLNAALRLDPGHRHAHERLLQYYERLGIEGREPAAYHRRQLAALK
jgi:hypothetical protein